MKAVREMKRVFVCKSFWDRSGIEEFLVEQAKDGWMLCEISDFFWRFRKEEPADVHYCVTYFSKASNFDAGPSKKEQQFRDLCEYTGWKLAADNGQMLIFCNYEKDPTPIETEDDIMLLAMHETAKRFFLPMCLFFVILGMIQFGTFLFRYLCDPWSILTSNAGILAGLCAIVVMILPLVSIGGYYHWHKRATKMIESGSEEWKNKGPLDLRVTIIVWMMFYLAFTILSFLGRSGILLGILILLGIFGTAVAVLAFSKQMKKRKISRTVNRTLTYTCSVICAAGLSVLMLIAMFQAVQTSKKEKVPVKVQTINGWTEKIYHDNLPLTVEDMIDTEYEGYSYEIRKESESVLCGIQQALQKPGIDALSEPRLSYRIVRVKCPMLYDLCKKQMKRDFAHDYGGSSEEKDFEKHLKIDGIPWGAKEAYRLCMGDEMQNRFLLCYENRIVEIDFGNGWIPNAQQMKLVAKRLGQSLNR